MSQNNTMAKDLVEKYFLDCWGDDGNGLDTEKRVAKKIYNRIKEDYSNIEIEGITEEAIYKATVEERRRLFGVPSYQDFDLLLFDILGGFCDAEECGYNEEEF